MLGAVRLLRLGGGKWRQWDSYYRDLQMRRYGADIGGDAIGIDRLSRGTLARLWHKPCLPHPCEEARIGKAMNP
jgi:hypothetical protein